MKRLWSIVSAVITVVLVVGVMGLYAANRQLREDIKQLEEKLDEVGQKEVQSDGMDLSYLKEKSSSLDSSAEEIMLEAERKIRILADEMSKTREILDKLPKMPEIDPDAEGSDNVLVTRSDVKKLLADELKKVGERRRGAWVRKEVTLDQLANELNLTYEQQLEMQKIHIKAEEEVVKILFAIKDDAQMADFKAKVAEAEYNPEVKKELQETMTRTIFSEWSKMIPVMIAARNEIRSSLGEEKAAEYEANNYDVDTQSDLSPAVKMMRDIFRPSRRGSSSEETE